MYADLCSSRIATDHFHRAQNLLQYRNRQTCNRAGLCMAFWRLMSTPAVVVLASTHSRGVLLYTGWDHYKFTNKLLKGEYQAVISDASQLVSISNKDQSCNLHILPDRILPFDIAVAFAKGFNDSELINNVDAAIVELQEAGMLLVRCYLSSRA
jgi:hypothetical protein